MPRRTYDKKAGRPRPPSYSGDSLRWLEDELHRTITRTHPPITGRNRTHA